MSDDKKPRAGSMSDADRALPSIKQRTAARVAGAPDFVTEEDSLPVLVDEYDDPTPVETGAGMPRRRRVTIQTFAEDTKLELRDLRARLNGAGLAAFNMRAELVERLIKLETRFETVLRLGGQVEDLADLARELGEFKVAMHGIDGKNGKLGLLKAEVGKARGEAARGPKMIRNAVAWAIGAFLGAVIPTAIYVKGIVEQSAAERAALHVEIGAGKAERAVLQSQVLLLFKLVNARNTSGFGPTPFGVITP